MVGQSVSRWVGWSFGGWLVGWSFGGLVGQSKVGGRLSGCWPIEWLVLVWLVVG